jgi:hypothetical protein
MLSLVKIDGKSTTVDLDSKESMAISLPESLQMKIEAPRGDFAAEMGIDTTTTVKTQQKASYELTDSIVAIQQVWPKELQPTAMAIAHAESNLNPNALSPVNSDGGKDAGLFQYHWGYELYGDQIFDPVFNSKVAYENKYLKGGWTHWTVYKTGAYLKWLPLYSG